MFSLTIIKVNHKYDVESGEITKQIMNNSSKITARKAA